MNSDQFKYLKFSSFLQNSLTWIFKEIWVQIRKIACVWIFMILLSDQMLSKNFLNGLSCKIRGGYVSSQLVFKIQVAFYLLKN